MQLAPFIPTILAHQPECDQAELHLFDTKRIPTSQKYAPTKYNHVCCVKYWCCVEAHLIFCYNQTSYQEHPTRASPHHSVATSKNSTLQSLHGPKATSIYIPTIDQAIHFLFFNREKAKRRDQFKVFLFKWVTHFRGFGPACSSCNVCDQRKGTLRKNQGMENERSNPAARDHLVGPCSDRQSWINVLCIVLLTRSKLLVQLCCTS